VDAERAADERLTVAVGQLLLGGNTARRRFDEPALEALALSLRRHGQLQPLVVRRVDGALPRALFEVIAGERRLLAARRAGLETLSVIVRGAADADALELALVENLQREDLSELEVAEGVVELVALTLGIPVEAANAMLYRLDNERRGRVPRAHLDGVTGQAVLALFERLGRLTLTTFVAKRLPLLSLPEDLRHALGAGQLRPVQARLLARLADPVQRATLVAFVVQHRPTAAALRARVEGVLEARRAPAWHGSLRSLRAQLSQVSEVQRERALTLLGELERVLGETSVGMSVVSAGSANAPVQGTQH
jgi:ParB family chromosome partitioning protein